MGLSISKNNSVEEFNPYDEQTLKMAMKKRIYKTNVVTHHSDRGFQYCSNEYQKLLKHSKINCSMTESYDPYANAVAERINGILKGEFIGYKSDIIGQTNREQYKVNRLQRY